MYFMKNKRNFIFAVCISIIYAATALTYGISLFLEYKSGSERTTARRAELIRETNQNLQVNEPGSEIFTNAFLRSIGDLSDFAGIQLVHNGNLIFSYPKNISENGSTKSSLVSVNSDDLRTQDGSKLTLTTALYKLTPKSIYNKGLAAFIVILAATLASVLYLISLYLATPHTPTVTTEEPEEEDLFKEIPTPADSFNEKNEDAAPPEDFPDSDDTNNITDEPYETPESDQTETDDTEAFDQEYDFPEDEIVTSNARSETSDETEAVGDSNKDFNSAADFEEADIAEAEDDFNPDENGYAPSPFMPNITQEEYQALTKDLLPEEETIKENEKTEDNDFTFSPVEETEPVVKQEENPDPILPPLEESINYSRLPDEDNSGDLQGDSASDAPKGLFSPVTGFGWEEYMLPRLDSELVRAASSDQDLALFTLSMPKFEWSGEAGQEVCRIIEDVFKFKDLIFEYKQSGCTAIVHNMDIDKALETAESLHTAIIAALAKRRLYTQIAIGISSRSLRLISGERIARESNEALNRALQDKDSPIVAFKVNPEKYRNYIAAEISKLDNAASE
ncbi:MAG TPA: hypothetical protein DCM57_05325 [Treponema sp.]|nr:hypothetical protein [Treponema sp.]